MLTLVCVSFVESKLLSILLRTNILKRATTLLKVGLVFIFRKFLKSALSTGFFLFATFMQPEQYALDTSKYS